MGRYRHYARTIRKSLARHVAVALLFGLFFGAAYASFAVADHLPSALLMGIVVLALVLHYKNFAAINVVQLDVDGDASLSKIEGNIVLPKAHTVRNTFMGEGGEDG